MNVVLHWVNTEFWGPVWPNLAASALCSVLVYVRLHVEAARRHEEIKRHVTAATAGHEEKT